MRDICSHPSLLNDESNDKKDSDQESEPEIDDTTQPNRDPYSELDKIKLKVDWWKPFCPDDMQSINHFGKMVLLFSIIKQCKAVGDKLFVFSQRLDTLDLIEKYLSRLKWERGVNYFRLDGKTSIDVRKKNCEKFNSVANTKARYTTYYAY